MITVLFRSRILFLTFISFSLQRCTVIYYETFISVHLIEEFEVSEKQTGWMILLPGLGLDAASMVLARTRVSQWTPHLLIGGAWICTGFVTFLMAMPNLALTAGGFLASFVFSSLLLPPLARVNKRELEANFDDKNFS